MRLAVVAAIGSYSPADLERKTRHLKSVLHPDTRVDMFTAASGVPYVESSFELYMTEVAVARKVVEIAGQGYDAVVGTAFLDNGLDAARELVDIPVVGPAKTTLYMAATLANRFAVRQALGLGPPGARGPGSRSGRPRARRRPSRRGASSSGPSTGRARRA